MSTITVLKDGPLMVKGADLVDGKGQPIEAKATMVLCRCGHSASKPFCDGAHKKAGFQDGA